MQGTIHADGMAASKEPMATQEHGMARDHPGDNPRMRLHPPATERTKEEQPATTEQGGLPRPNPTPPYHPIGIGIPDMGPEV